MLTGRSWQQRGLDCPTQQIANSSCLLRSSLHLALATMHLLMQLEGHFSEPVCMCTVSCVTERAGAPCRAESRAAQRRRVGCQTHPTSAPAHAHRSRPSPPGGVYGREGRSLLGSWVCQSPTCFSSISSSLSFSCQLRGQSCMHACLPDCVLLRVRGLLCTLQASGAPSVGATHPNTHKCTNMCKFLRCTAIFPLLWSLSGLVVCRLSRPPATHNTPTFAPGNTGCFAHILSQAPAPVAGRQCASADVQDEGPPCACCLPSAQHNLKPS